MTTTHRIGYAPGTTPRNNVIQFLEEHAASRPEQVALLAPDPGALRAWKPGSALPHVAVPVATLAARVESAAAGLACLGLAKGDRVFLFVPMSVDLYVAMFAVQRIGAIAVFLDSWARRDQLGLCAAQVSPRGFIGPAPAFALLDGIPALAQAPVRVVTGPAAVPGAEPLDALAGARRRIPVCPVAMEDTALVTFTTGSSGPPKGANRTHRFLAAQHHALDACLPYGPGDVDLPVFPIFSLNNIAGGVTTVLPAIDLARPGEHDGPLLLAQLQTTSATSCTLSPSLLRAVCAAAAGAGQTLAGLRRVAAGGAPIGPDDVAALRRIAPHAAMHILYGSTEVEPIAHLVADSAVFGSGEGVCVGRLSAGLDAKFLRLSRDPIELGAGGWGEWELPPGQAGELVVSGEHVCRDYFANPEAFSRAKIADATGRVWHRTGDVCRLAADGRLWVLGRVHTTIQRAGEPLFPVKPELVMRGLAFVQAAAYLGLPHPQFGEQAIAAFSLKPGAAPADPEGEVARALAAAGVVTDRIVRVDAIPLDPRHHSKVEYAALRATLEAIR